MSTIIDSFYRQHVRDVRFPETGGLGPFEPLDVGAGTDLRSSARKGSTLNIQRSLQPLGFYFY